MKDVRRGRSSGVSWVVPVGLILLGLLATLACCVAVVEHQVGIAMTKDDDRLLMWLAPISTGRFARDSKGRTTLMWAASRGQVGIAKVLIRRGVDVNARDHSGHTALMWSVGHRPSIELLLRSGADVNAKSDSGTTVLHTVTFFHLKDRDVILRLLNLGADPNVSDLYGETPLILCARRGDLRGLRELLAFGARLDTRNKEGLTATDEARRFRQESAYRYLKHYRGGGEPRP